MPAWLEVTASLLNVAVLIAIPLIVVALAGLFSERSGVVNIALEGIMVMGAVFGLFFVSLIDTAAPNISGGLLFLIGSLVAILIGSGFSALHAYASVNMKANQIISGTALNLFAPAFGIFFARAVFNTSKLTYNFRKFYLRDVKIPVLYDIPFISEIFFQDTYLLIYVGILILIISSIVLYKTKFGLRLRSCGEHPQAADAAGINVYKMRWAGVLISGALAGLGGFYYVLPIGGGVWSSEFAVSGLGFLALAVLISGQWKPSRIVLMAFVFGIASKISNKSGEIPFLRDLTFTSDSALNSDIKDPLLKIIPYLITLIVLIFTSRNSAGPKAAGEPYDAGKR